MFDAHAELAARLHALIAAVAAQIPAETTALADEMVDANEGPVALEILSDVLAERSAVVTPAIVSEFEQLAEGLGLGPEVAGRLRS